MQAGQEPAGELPFTRSLVHGETDRFLYNFGVILLTSQFIESTNDLVRITGIKVLLDAFRQLQFELGQGQHGAINSFVGSGIVAAFVGIGVSTAAEHVFVQVLRFIVERILFVNGHFNRVGRIQLLLPLPLAVTTLFLERAVVVARIFVGCLFASNVAFGRAFFDFGFVQGSVLFGLCGGCWGGGCLFGLFGSLGLNLRRNGANAFSRWIVDLSLSSSCINREMEVRGLDAARDEQATR